MADALASTSGRQLSASLLPLSTSHATSLSSSGSGQFAVPLPPQSPSLSGGSGYSAVPQSPSLTNPVPPPPRSGRPGVRMRTTQVRAPSQGGSPSPGRGSNSNVSPDLGDTTAQDMRALREELEAERSLRVAAERKVEQLEDKLQATIVLEQLHNGDVAGPRGSARSAIKARGHCAQCAAREAAQLDGDLISPSARQVQSLRSTLALDGPRRSVPRHQVSRNCLSGHNSLCVMC